jgi:uncharacterized UPF0146 family protein
MLIIIADRRFQVEVSICFKNDQRRTIEARSRSGMSSLRGAEDLAEFIGQNYSGRIVEVGAGYVPAVALQLLARGLEVVLTDKEERMLGSLRVEKDDIFAPRMALYQGASLIYSIRPPLELQIAMGDVAARVGADVLIRPLQDEVAELPGFARKLVNVGEARFYLFRAKGTDCGNGL